MATQPDRHRTDTERRVLEAALHAIGRRGTTRISMADVSSLAGVSRSTVYRHFPTRDDLLRAIATYERERFESGANSILVDLPEGHARVKALLSFSVEYLVEHPAYLRVIESEPAFFLRLLRRHQEALRRALHDTIGSGLEDAPVVRSGAITVEQLVDLLHRLQLSMFLLPPRDFYRTDEALQTLVSVLLPDHEPKTRRGAARRRGIRSR